MYKQFSSIQRLDFLRERVEGRSVLHLGCTNHPYTHESIEKGTFLHKDIVEKASVTCGFDFDEEGLEALRALGYTDLYRADLEKLEDVGLDTTFDVIIAGEVIEHLKNPGSFLEGIKRFMHNGTELILTTVNAYAAFRFAAYALRGRGGVNEPVHPDHVFYFSYKTIKKLVESAGFKETEFYFYDIGTEHRPTNRWYYNMINDMADKISPHLSDGVIIVCKLKNAP